MTIAPSAAETLHTTGGDKAVDNGGLRYGAMKSALRPPLPTAAQLAAPNRPSQRLGRLANQTALTNPVQANIIASDPRKQTSGGRHQIGTLAGFKSESVAGFILECLAGFVGIRTVDMWTTRPQASPTRIVAR
jgi:hypothetical protein